jgi:hypothetical protein
MSTEALVSLSQMLAGQRDTDNQVPHSGLESKTDMVSDCHLSLVVT